MRSFRILTVVLAVVFVSTSAFARICHPKQPITCGVSTLSAPAATLHAAKPHSTPVIKLAMACGPWVKTFPYCAGTTLTGTTKPATTVKPKAPAKLHEEAMCCGPWVKTFPYCSAKTLG